jgi:hypothetical protein
MLQHADHVRLGEKHLAGDPLAVLVPAGIDVVDLDRHVAAVVGIVRQIDDACAAAANLVDDHVLAYFLRQGSASVQRLGGMGPNVAQGWTARDVAPTLIDVGKDTGAPGAIL